MMRTACLLLASLGIAGCSDDAPPSLQDAIHRLETWSGYRNPALETLLQTVRNEGARGDPLLWQRLKRIVLDEDRPLTVRAETLKIACDKADAEIAEDIMQLVSPWPEQVAPLVDRLGVVANNRDQARVHLMWTAATVCAQSLEHVIENQNTLLSFLTDAVTTVPGPGRERFECYRVIAQNPAPLEMRRETAVKAIAAIPKSKLCPRPLAGLLDDSVLPELRKYVRTSDDPKTFHFGAAAALAELGDQEILPQLEALLPRFRAGYAEEHLLTYIWRIKIQHPPLKLLDYIRSADEEYGARRRIWAIRRAADLGLDQGRIRKAILEYASRDDLSEFARKVGLLQVKEAALELGILKPTDLPDVKRSDLLPTREP